MGILLRTTIEISVRCCLRKDFQIITLKMARMTSKKTKMNKEYQAKRERNNDAVRRSREKARLRQEHTLEAVRNLRKENEELENKKVIDQRAPILQRNVQKEYRSNNVVTAQWRPLSNSTKSSFIEEVIQTLLVSKRKSTSQAIHRSSIQNLSYQYKFSQSCKNGTRLLYISNFVF